MIDDAVTELADITDKVHIDWTAFDNTLRNLEDINILDDDSEETILSKYITDGDFYGRGEILPIAVQHFLSNGYDVHAHNGKNGGLALSALCWSSYDRSILEAAKMLMNAGAPVIYSSQDDEPDEEPRGLFYSISWKDAGAWEVDKDYTWANILEAYYSMAEAYAAKKDYCSILCYLDCIGAEVTAIFADKDDSDNLSFANEYIRQLGNSLVIFFDDKPLVINTYIELVVNPIYVSDNRELLVDVSKAFSPLIGAKLTDVKYTDAAACSFYFSNGVRLLLASRDAVDGKRIYAWCDSLYSSMESTSSAENSSAASIVASNRTFIETNIQRTLELLEK